jgi:BA14K-like protein
LTNNLGEFVMTISSKISTAALMAVAAPWLIAPATSAPLSSPLGLQNTVTPSIETVQYRRGWRYGYRHGGFVGDGLGLAGAGIGLAGAIVGGAIVGATHPYGYGPGYAYAPGYVAVSPYNDGSEVGYCEQRFRSYDPGSGTYLGFDGLRHPCP